MQFWVGIEFVMVRLIGDANIQQEILFANYLS